MLTGYSALERELLSAIGPLRLVAVSYLSTAPAGVSQFSGTVPAGCTFWRLASTGNGFYTVPSDHFNCPVGSYTHAIDLPAGRAGELEQRLTLMADIGYMKIEEGRSIPRLPETPAFVYYAPLGKAVVAPDVVIASGRPASLVQLQDAATRASGRGPRWGWCGCRTPRRAPARLLRCRSMADRRAWRSPPPWRTER